jgi:hypothetical protein
MAMVVGWSLSLTTLLNALDCSTRDGLVYDLGSILDNLDWALACDRGGAEQAGLAGDLLAEHGDVDVGFVWLKR